MAVRQVYNNFFIGLKTEMSGTTMNSGCVYLAEDTKELYGVDVAQNTFLIGGEEVISDKYHKHIITIPSNNITIIHPLEKFPSVTIKDDFGYEIEASVNFISQMEINVVFNTNFTGVIYLN